MDRAPAGPACSPPAARMPGRGLWTAPPPRWRHRGERSSCPPSVRPVPEWVPPRRRGVAAVAYGASVPGSTPDANAYPSRPAPRRCRRGRACAARRPQARGRCRGCRGDRRRRGPSQCPAPADGDGLPRAGPHRGAHPGRVQSRGGAPLGGADGREAADPRGAPSAVARRGRRADGARPRALGRPLRRRGRAGQRPVGREPAPPVGFLHAGRPQHPAVEPAAVDAGVRRRLRARARARPPDRGRPRRAVLGAGRPLPARGAGPGLPGGRRAGQHGRGGRRRRAAAADHVD